MSAPAAPREVFTTDWQGIALSVAYTPDWLGLAVHVGQSAHLFRSAGRQPLPISEAGYRSHFANPGDVAAAGGPVAYALAWLNEAACSRRWRDRPESTGQLSLF